MVSQRMATDSISHPVRICSKKCTGREASETSETRVRESHREHKLRCRTSGLTPKEDTKRTKIVHTSRLMIFGRSDARGMRHSH